MPAPIGTQLGPALTPDACANAGEAINSAASVMNAYCSFRILFSCFLKIAASGWLRLTVLAPSR
jgi:hypothetical protein